MSYSDKVAQVTRTISKSVLSRTFWNDTDCDNEQVLSWVFKRNRWKYKFTM